MFRKPAYRETQATRDAAMRSPAVIAFGTGSIGLRANPNVRAVVGYDLASLPGGHRRVFVGNDVAKSPNGAEVWARLRAGEFVSGEVLRRAQAGAKDWLEATDTPILGPNGWLLKVVKFAYAITAKKNGTSRLPRMIDEMPVSVMTAA
jgi:methyl-accepting chemotaxis protein